MATTGIDWYQSVPISSHVGSSRQAKHMQYTCTSTCTISTDAHLKCREIWFLKYFKVIPPIEPRQANLCLRTFRHDKFQLRMPSHSEGPGIWLSV